MEIDNDTQSGVWFAAMYFRFVWRATIMPLAIIWHFLKGAGFFIARVLGSR